MEHVREDSKSVLARYFHEIREFRSLSREEELELAENVRRGCDRSFEKLIEANLGFVVRVASEFRNLGLPFEDLLNEGNLGLIEAARRYDATKGTKFITYAIWWIRKSILRALAERSALVRLPSYQMKKVREIRRAEEVLRRVLGRKPWRSEISRSVERTESQVEQAMQFTQHSMSLDETAHSEGGNPISDSLIDEANDSVEEAMIRREDKGLIQEALGALSAQERFVVHHRFGIGGGPPATLRQIGDMMGVSRERVRQIEGHAKTKIRRFFAGRTTLTARAPRRAYQSGPVASRRRLDNH
jgi:RNA polymerase primary sigma factor